MKILVTGASGFIGQNLIKIFLEKEYEIHVVVRPNSDTLSIDKRASVFIYSGKTDELISYCKAEKFDGIMHLASLFLASHTNNDIENLISSNIMFGTQLLEAAVQSKIKWFLNTGTFWQNYEDEVYNPVNLYAATKEAFENIAEFYIQTSDIIFTTVKLSDTFGPNDTRNKIFNFWGKIANSSEVLDMSAGEQIIDISYIEDVLNAFDIMIVNLNSKEAIRYNNKNYVVSNNERMSLKELSKVFEKATGKILNINWGGREYRQREVMKPYSKGEKVPNWEQKFSLEEAIKNVMKDIEND